MSRDAFYVGAQWNLRTVNPSKAGWYFTKSTANGRDYVTVRYFDDVKRTWYCYSNTNDVQTLVPNNSFAYWLYLEGIHAR